MNKVLKYKKIYIVIVLFADSISLAADQFKTYCEATYGEGATLTYEPLNANGEGVIDSFISHKSRVIKTKDTPEPTGFKCQIPYKMKEKKRCPKGMYYNSKRIKLPICITNKIDLRELCPKEIAEVWPELRDQICIKTSSKK